MSLRDPKRHAIGGVSMLVCIVAWFAGSGIFGGLERGLLPLKYELRGNRAIDSSVVVIALTGDDIDALGGLPLKRSYYALLVRALSDLGAGVIGLDLGLSDEGRAGAEHDRLLAREIAAAGNVVMSGYFRALSDSALTGPNPEPLPQKASRPPPPLDDETTWLTGRQFQSPQEPIASAAAAIGHTNLTEESGIPLFVRYGGNVVHSFALELLLRSRNITEVKSVPGELLLIHGSGRGSGGNTGGAAGSIAIPHGPTGDASLNFPGGPASLNFMSFLDFFSAYDDPVGGRGAVADMVRGKTVVVGVVSEGRSLFLDLPNGERLPAVALHAVFLHNAARGDFMRSVSGPVMLVIMIGIGFTAIVFIRTREEARGVLLVFIVVVIATIGSFLLFSDAAIVLPVTGIWFCGGVMTTAMLIYNHKVAGTQIESLLIEKEKIARIMREKETQLRSLTAQFEHGGGEATELVGQIERYKAEVARLRAIETDLREYHGVEPAAVVPGGRREFHGIIYASEAMHAVVEFIRKISASDATVMITGESGSGKEMIARAVHLSSPRAAEPFVAVNCGALTETLLESELFGHERGAFTGAVRERAGRFEAAGSGTILLDEVAETNEAFQVKLLRVLQDGTYERVGGTVTLKSAARVVAATNRELKDAVEKKSFRPDLFYRLNVLSVHVPPLRERQADIPVLASAFIAAEDPGMKCSQGVMNSLVAHRWDGNVRELQSVIVRAVLLARSDKRNLLRLKDLPAEIAVRSQGDIETLIIASLREKGFSRSAISETADEIGGFNRGTVAEYFRGFCFKVFCASGMDAGRASRMIAGVDGPAGQPGQPGQQARIEIEEKATKKLLEYIQNAVESAQSAATPEEAISASASKFKNLPQRYHPHLEEILRAAQSGTLRLG